MEEDDAEEIRQICKQAGIKLETIGDENGEAGDKVRRALGIALSWRENHHDEAQPRGFRRWRGLNQPRG